MNESIGSFPTWDGMRVLEARVATLTADREILLSDIADLRDRLAAVETLLDEWDEDTRRLGFRAAPTSAKLRAAARGEGDREVDTQLHHDFEPPPASTGPDGCRRCGQSEASVVHR